MTDGEPEPVGPEPLEPQALEKVLSYASPLLLYAEEIDPRSGRHLGNFPQAFTHLALINAVMHVITDEHAARRPCPPTPSGSRLHQAGRVSRPGRGGGRSSPWDWRRSAAAAAARAWEAR